MKFFRRGPLLSYARLTVLVPKEDSRGGRDEDVFASPKVVEVHGWLLRDARYWRARR
jgi:hypothetical protein